MNANSYGFPLYMFPGLHIAEEFGRVEYFDASRINSDKEGLLLACEIVVKVHRKWFQHLWDRISNLGYESRGLKKVGKYTYLAHLTAVIRIPLI